MNDSTPLEISFSLERLKRYLLQHPEQAVEQALQYSEDFFLLSLKFRRLEQDLAASHIRLNELQQQLQSSPSPQLPPFLSSTL
jgi:hypothetical protein